jgi:hypothetical protein
MLGERCVRLLDVILRASQTPRGGRNDTTAIVVALAALGALVATLTASATTTQELRAELHDNLACPAGFDLCGKGVLHHFGTVTTTLTFTGFGPGPGNCTSVTADRVLTLDSDGSTLDLSVAGILCPQGNSGGQAPGKGSGTFTVAGGTGRFSGASGSGRLSVQATGVPLPSDTAQYDGTLTLP